MAPEWLPSDGSDTEDPSHAFNDDHIVEDPVTNHGSEETATHVEQDAEVENTLPPRLKRDDPEHKMMPGGHGLRPTESTPSQRLHGDGSTSTSATGGDNADARPNNPLAVWTLGPVGSNQLGWVHAHL